MRFFVAVYTAREHDCNHLEIDEKWRGYGLLADLGYASIDRLRDCERYGVRFVIRLKEDWKVKVDRITRGELSRAITPGADLDMLCEDEVLLLDGTAIDADVGLGLNGNKFKTRMVGVPTPKGYCFYLTNLPRTIGPIQVGDIYRVRWEVELSFKIDKSAYRLDKGKGERTCSMKALLYASLIASTITAILAHKHNLSTRSALPGDTRTRPPLHSHRLALALCVGARDIAKAFLLAGNAASREWDELANCLVANAKDPNWRRRPSVLDQIRGWKPQTGTPKARRKGST